MEEIWKPVEGFEGYYEISNLGRVKSLHKKSRVSIMKPTRRQDEYYMISLQKGDTRTKLRIHRMVAIAFLPNPDNKPEVNHLNGIKDDNRLENLEWATGQENVLHAMRIGLIKKKEKQVKPMAYPSGYLNCRPVDKFTLNGEYVTTYPSLSIAALSNGVCLTSIHKVVKGQRKATNGFKYAYSASQKSTELPPEKVRETWKNIYYPEQQKKISRYVVRRTG